MMLLSEAKTKFAKINGKKLTLDLPSDPDPMLESAVSGNFVHNFMFLSETQHLCIEQLGV